MLDAIALIGAGFQLLLFRTGYDAGHCKRSNLLRLLEELLP